MNIQDLVRNLSREKRVLLCELLIEIILDSKNKISYDLVLNILALWAKKQLITIKNTMSLIKTSYEIDPIATRVLLSKMDLIPFSEVIEVEALNG